MSYSKANLESLAQELLDELGIHGIPVAVDKIARALGAQVTYTPLDEELSGMVFIKDGTPIIGVNSLHSNNRQRFTVAHEIAHLRLHRQYITEAVHVDKRFAESVLRRDSKSAEGTQKLEIEANRFGAALLLPRRHLEPLLENADLDIEDEQALEVFARKFKVSKATLQYRIHNLAHQSAMPASRGGL